MKKSLLICDVHAEKQLRPAVDRLRAPLTGLCVDVCAECLGRVQRMVGWRGQKGRVATLGEQSQRGALITPLVQWVKQVGGAASAGALQGEFRRRGLSVTTIKSLCRRAKVARQLTVRGHGRGSTYLIPKKTRAG